MQGALQWETLFAGLYQQDASSSLPSNNQDLANTALADSNLRLTIFCSRLSKSKLNFTYDFNISSWFVLDWPNSTQLPGVKWVKMMQPSLNSWTDDDQIKLKESQSRFWKCFQNCPRFLFLQLKLINFNFLTSVTNYQLFSILKMYAIRFIGRTKFLCNWKLFWIFFLKVFCNLQAI